MNKLKKPAESVVQEFDRKIRETMRGYEVPAGSDKKEILEKILTKIEEGNTKGQEQSKIFFLSPVYRIAISTAASLLLLFLLHFFMSTIKISSKDLISSSYTLPDNSRIVLDFESSFSYPRYWWKHEVSLNGNAYFEVEKGENFTVKTKYGKVKVLGTRFNIEETSDGLLIECFEGKIKFKTKRNEQHIDAGSAIVLKGEKIEVKKQTTEDYPDIAMFNQHFSQVNIKVVAEEIEYFFNIKIELKDTTLQKHFSGHIYASDCKEALKMLCEPLALKYSFDETSEQFIIEENQNP